VLNVVIVNLTGLILDLFLLELTHNEQVRLVTNCEPKLTTKQISKKPAAATTHISLPQLNF